MFVFPQTRSSSLHGVEEIFRLVGTKIFKNIQIFCWAVLPQARPSFFHGVEKPFRLDVTQQFKHIQVYAWAALPNIPVPAKLISRRWKIFSSWCYADFQQRSIERMIVLPQTRSSAFHGVEKSFRLDGMKLFNNIRSYGWAVLPQARPSSFNGVEETFRLDVMQPGKTFQVKGWAALPNIPSHGPLRFAALRNRFVLMLCRVSTTFKWTAGHAPTNTVQRISRYWRTFSFG